MDTKTVTVQAVQWHTYNGKAYEIGDTYELDEALVDSVQAQGKAFRVGKPPAPEKKASHPVEPMATHNVPTPKKHAK